MRLVAPITVGNEIPLAIVDDEDYEIVSKFKWHIQRVYTGGFYYRTAINNKKVYMHRLITKAQEDEEVDHINRIIHDNRRINLRICGRTGNCQNKSSMIGATSKYLGVSYVSHANRWAAELRKNYKRVFRNSYLTEEQAALAYNDAAIKYHGEFANLNIVPNEKYYRMLTLLKRG